MPVDTAAIKAKVRLEDVVQGYIGQMKKHGGDFVACCPFHDEKTPSFVVHQEAQYFKCFGCGAKGDVIEFVKLYEKCDFNAAVEKLGGAATTRPAPAPRQLPAPAATPAKASQVFATQDLLNKAVAYHAHSKGGKVVARFYYPDGLIIYRVELPPKDGKKRGKYFTQCHAVEGGFVYGGIPRCQLYHVEELKDAPEVNIVEGEVKADKLRALGFPATCSAGGSSAAAKTDWRPLAGKTVIFWRDNDAPGEKFQADVLAILNELLPRPQVSFIPVNDLGLPPGGDAVDFIAKYVLRDEAINAVKCVLQTAVGIGALAALHQELADAVSGVRFNLTTPWPVFDSQVNGLIPSGVLLIGGDPGSTKSLALLQCMRHWISEHVPTACLMLENSVPLALRRALAQICGESSVTIDAWCKANPDRLKEYQRAADSELHALSSVIETLPDGTEPTTDKILAWIDRRLEAGARIVCIDPITALQTGPQPWAEHSRFVWESKRMIEKAKASLLLITHPAGQHYGKSQNLDCMSGGKAYTRFSQSVVFLSVKKQEKKDITVSTGRISEDVNRTFNIWKANNGRAPKNCKIALWFDWHTLTLKELGTLED